MTPGSSGRILSDGVTVSSNCPRRTAQMKAIRKHDATITLAPMSTKMADIPYNPSRRAAQRVARTANSTTEIELTGIKMADTNGDNFPIQANAMPIMLYIIENTNPINTILTLRRLRRKNEAR